MNKTALSILMAIIVCIGIFVSPTKTYAVSAGEVAVELDTDKTEYAEGEDILIDVEVENTNDYPVKNVEIINLTSDEYAVINTADSQFRVDSLNPGETANIKLTLSTSAEKSNVGMYIIIGIGALLLITLLVLGIVFIIKNKSAKNAVAVFVCVLVLGSTASIFPVEAADTKSISESVEAEKTITVNGEEVDIAVRVEYEVEEEVPDEKCLVIFNTDEGTEIPDVEVDKGSLIQMPEAPVKENAVFTGWYTNKKCNEKFIFETTPIVEDTVIYAGWVSGDHDTMIAEYAASQLDIIYQQGDNINHVSRDITLETEVEDVEGVVVTWTSSSDLISSDGRVSRPETSDETVKLTLTVVKNEATAEREYELNVVHASDRNADEISNSSVVDIENMNEGEEFDISYNQDKTQVVSIEGKYSDVIVDNADDALDVIHSIRTVVGMNNAYEELDIITSNADEYGAEYIFSQKYNGYEVYGRKITVSVDSDGVTDSMSSGVYASNKLDNTDSEVLIERTEAERIAVSYYGGECEADSEQTELVYYTLNEFENAPVFVYAVNVTGEDSDESYVDADVFVSAKEGDIIAVDSAIVHASADTGKGKNELGSKVTFPVAFTWTDFYFFYMQDLDRDIQVYNQICFNDFRIGSEFNWWTDETAVSAYTNIITTYDWYKSVLNRDSIDGNSCDIDVVVHDDNYTENAYWNSSACSINFCNNSWGSSLNTTTAGALDVAAHEYTHGVFDRITGRIPYSNATGAIDEGYADVMACLIDGNWQIGEDWTTIRDASNPTAHQCPDKMSSQFYIDYTTDTRDGGGVHTNSSLVYHAAYLMSEGGISDTTLAKLWYKSMFMGYDATSDFQTVRRNVLKAAKKINLSEDEITIIKSAFDDVEIFGDRGTLEGTIKDMNDAVPANAVINIIHNGSVVQTLTADAEGKFNVLLDEGEYTVEITADGYVKYVSFVEIEEAETTAIEAVLVQEGCGKVNGTVVSATSALAVEGAQLNVRLGLNTRVGNIITSSATDSEGKYSFELNAGYYTIEIIKDGYTTGYINAIVYSATETVVNGSLSPIMTSNTYRAVLTWGANPSDLDSHLEGQAADGSSYHVFYSDRNGYDSNGDNIANLDVDDISSYGPETTTFTVDTEGTYNFYVHRYSSGSLPASEAKVKVYNGYNLIAEYRVDSNASSNCRYWNVFRIENGILQTVNEMN